MEQRCSVARLIRRSSRLRRVSGRWSRPKAVRRRPFAVVLFDEIEARTGTYQCAAADPRRRPSTDGPGPYRGLQNTVIIMTSNVGSQLIPVAGAPVSRTTSSPAYIEMKEEVLNAAPADSGRGSSIAWTRSWCSTASRATTSAGSSTSSSTASASRVSPIDESGSCCRRPRRSVWWNRIFDPCTAPGLSQASSAA